MYLHFRCIVYDLMQGEVVGISVCPQGLKLVHVATVDLLIHPEKQEVR